MGSASLGVTTTTGLRAVLDERGNDLLCVSFVKGHASAEDISLGRASVKEALWNGAADRLAVAGAALHALPPSVLLRHQRQVTVTVLMQTMLLHIHGARTHAWQQHQLRAPAVDPSDGADQFDADEAAAREMHEPAACQLDAQAVFNKPKLALPRYCWDKPQDGERFSLPQLPPRIGAARASKDRHKGCPTHLPWCHGYGLVEPLYWFWASLRWVHEAAAVDDTVTATSYIELAIAFQLVTGVLPADAKAGDAPSMQQRGHFFAAASKRLSAILGAPLAPGKPAAQPDVLRRLRFQTSLA